MNNQTTATILHLCSEQAWRTAQTRGEYRANTLDTEDYMHCSRPEQVAGTANRYYVGRRDMILLVIDPDKVHAEIRYEPAKNGQLYPHIYGPLNLDAVTGTLPYKPDADGSYSAPKL